MKLTTTELQRIIQEELDELADRLDRTDEGVYDDAVKAAHKVKRGLGKDYRKAKRLAKDPRGTWKKIKGGARQIKQDAERAAGEIKQDVKTGAKKVVRARRSIINARDRALKKAWEVATDPKERAELKRAIVKAARDQNELARERRKPNVKRAHKIGRKIKKAVGLDEQSPGTE